MNKPGNHFAKKSMPAIKTKCESSPSRLAMKVLVALVAIFAIEAIVLAYAGRNHFWQSRAVSHL